MKIIRLMLLVVGWSMLTLTVAAADWPQWRGPDRSGVSKETGLLKTWPKDGPPSLWIYDAGGAGYSAPAIVGDRLFCMGGRGDSEFVYALEVKSAKQLWATKIGPLFTWKGNTWNAGPSASPTVDGDLVYALGGLGELVCVEAAGGKEVWRKNLPKELGAVVNDIGGGADNLGWGFAWSPQIDGDKLICTPGGPQGTVAALDKKTGKVLWQSKALTNPSTYASPVVAEIGGVRQCVLMINDGAAGVSTKDGQLLWTYKRNPAYDDVVIPTPVVQGDQVYTTVGHGAGTAGCDLIKLTADGQKFKAERVYGNKSMKNMQGGVVLVGDNIYGYSDRGGWTCQSFKTGKVVGDEYKKLGSGSVIAAEGQLYCFADGDGTLALMETAPNTWKENGRFKIPQESKLRKPSGKLWTPPVIANGRLYLRDQNLIFCYDIKAK